MMKKKDVKKLQEGLIVRGRMKQAMSLPMQGVSFSAEESVDVIPYRPGGSMVVVTSTLDSKKRVEMSLYQVEQFIS
jgi:hypothetical protein